MQCKFTKSDGSQCKARALKDNIFCPSHQNLISKTENNPPNENGPQENRKNQSHLVISIPELNINNPGDLPPFLIDTIRNVRSGVMNSRVGSVIGYLTGMLLRSYEVTDMNERIEKIERLISGSFVEIKPDM